VLIPHAFNTTNHKAVLAVGGSSEFTVETVAARWGSVAAITSVTIFEGVGDDFAVGTTVHLGVVDERYLVEEWLSAGTGVAIFDNIPEDPLDETSFSMPGNLLWIISPSETMLQIIEVDPPSMQGWYDPNLPESERYVPDNHERYFQYNLTDIAGLVGPDETPFWQTKDEVYWLAISVMVVDDGGIDEAQWGWKTADVNQYPAPDTGEHYLDDAVWADSNVGTGFDWAELVDPASVSLDLAFVITPEPATMTVMGLGAIAVLVRRRRRRI
ncbi:hypothetical protein LCGC14_2023110, partial [marine sediment metagenome]